FLFVVLLKLLSHLSPLPSHPSPRTSHLVPLTSSFVHLLLLPLIIIGLRGGTSVSTTNVGQVYFSQNQFLNHSAVNPVFSFLSSIGKSTNDIPSYRFFNDEELPKDLFHTPRSPVISCITATTSTPNILLIIMESCGGQFTELGGNAHVTPNLTQLAHEGVYFTRCYANSWRTDRGMLSIMSGYPALPKTSIMKMPSKVRTLPSIASTLQRAGYSTTFLYGGDANFTNTRGYLMATGVETIISEDDFTNEERGSSKWGVCDSITFDRLFNMVGDEQRFLPKEEQRFLPKKTAPWFTTFLTLSSHEPWTVPMPTRFADEKLNAFYYLDRCIGRFIERFRKTEAWKKTLVIIIPDHGILYKDQDETKEIRSHIPMIWTGGVVSQPMQIDKLCNQSDLAATLLGQLGLPHDDFTFSRDILSPDYTRPFAMHTFPEGFSVVDESGFNVYDLNTQHQTIGHSPEAIRLGKMILQLTADDLRSR
ncbi:MAG: LTA synthase family protein, partial [Prevotella sp.]|nr:LTA synthase family protein [Prevotella sp.]